MGLTAYPGIAVARGPIYVVLLAVRSTQLWPHSKHAVLQQMSGCVMFSADLAESGAEGATHQDELVRIGRTHRRWPSGPNCNSFIYPHLEVSAYFRHCSCSGADAT